MATNPAPPWLAALAMCRTSGSGDKQGAPQAEVNAQGGRATYFTFCSTSSATSGYSRRRQSGQIAWLNSASECSCT